MISESEILKVEASAGAGKTFALARRYIEILFDKNNMDLPVFDVIRGVLAITFTNKAAFEMKKRILLFLKKIASDEFSSESERNALLSVIDEDAGDVQERASEYIEYILRHYDYFQVQTIDSFVNSILQGCSFRLKRSGAFQIEYEEDELLAYSLDEYIDEAIKDENAFSVLDDFIEHYLFVNPQPMWIPKRDMLSEVKKLYTLVTKIGGAPCESGVDDNVVFILKRNIAEILTFISDNLPEGTKLPVARKINKLAEAGMSFTASDFSTTFTSEFFPIKKKFDVPEKIESAWDRLRESIKKYCEAEALTVYNPYVKLFSSVMPLFCARSSKEDIIFLSSINREASVLYEAKDLTVNEIFCRLAARITHFLLDEFQDTSRLQWNNMRPLIEDAVSSGGSVFYVGDRKQAIYRFRGGDATLFDSVKDDIPSGVPAEEALLTNYRSSKNVVSFVNDIFEKENLLHFLQDLGADKKEKSETAFFAEKDIRDILNGFSKSEQKALPDKSAGYVKVESVSDSDETSSQEQIYDQLMTKIRSAVDRGYKFSQIGVLVRENSRVEEISELLINSNIPVNSEKTLNIKNCSLVNEIIAFIKFIDSPIDDLSFASFICGDIFLKKTGLSFEEINRFLFDVRLEKSSSKEPVYLYIRFRDIYPDIWSEYIERDFFKKVGLFPVYELVSRFISVFGLYDTFRDQTGYFKCLLELIKAEESKHPSLSSIIAYYEDMKDDDFRLYVKGQDAGDAVNIMTFHKAKGLEFDVVIIPFLSLKVRTGGFVYRPVENGFNIIRIQKAYNEWSDNLKDLYKQEYKAELVSELNSVYVALTRAGMELHVLMPDRIGMREYNRISYLIRDVEIGDLPTIDQCDSSVADPDYLYSTPYTDWAEMIKTEFISNSELMRRHSILKGEFIHSVFSKIEKVTENDYRSVVDMAFQETKEEFRTLNYSDDWKDIITNLLLHERLKPYYYSDDIEVFNERSVVGPDGNTRRIDRLVMRENDLTIIDYKTSKESSEEYRQQMRGYGGILKEVYPDKTIHAVIVFVDPVALEFVDVEE